MLKRGVLMRWRVVIAVITANLGQGVVEIALHANAEGGCAIGDDLALICKANEKSWQFDPEGDARQYVCSISFMLMRAMRGRESDRSAFKICGRGYELKLGLG
jgi:hypothetical protein